MSGKRGGQLPISGLIGKGSVYVAASGLQLAAGVLVLPFLTRSFTVDLYGELVTALVVAQTLTFLAAAGIGVSVLREYYDEATGPMASRRLVSLALVVAAVVGVIAHLTGPIWTSIFSGIDYGPLMEWAVVLGALQGAMEGSQAQLRAQGRPLWFASSALGRTVVGPVAGLVWIHLVGGGPASYLGVVAVVTAFSLLASMLVGGTAVPRARDRKLVRRSLLIGLPAVPHGLALYVIAAGDRVVVERLMGLSEVGRYQLAYVVGTLGILLVQAINNSWTPVVMAGRGADRWKRLAQTSAVVEGLVAAAAVGVAVTAPLVLRIAAPASYDIGDLAPIAAVLTMAALPFTAYAAHVQIAFVTGRTHMLAWVSPLVAVANLLGNVVAVRAFGLAGAAVVTVCSYVLQWGLIDLTTRRHASVPWRWGLRWTAWVVSVVGALGAAWMPLSGPWPGIRVIVAAGCAVFVVASARRALRLEAQADLLEDSAARS